MRQRWFLTSLLILGFVVIVALTGNILMRQTVATFELLLTPPTRVRVTQTESGGYTLEHPHAPPTDFIFQITPAMRELYQVMRTRQETDFGPGGCRIVSGLGEDKAYHYTITFYRDNAIMLEAMLAPECNRWTLTKNDAWFLRHFTNADAYSSGTYGADRTLRDAFLAATQLPYP